MILRLIFYNLAISLSEEYTPLSIAESEVMTAQFERVTGRVGAKERCLPEKGNQSTTWPHS